MDLRKLVGARVKTIRQALRLSQAKLAERTGLAVETISRIERGVRGTTLENLYRMAQALEVPFPEMLDFDEPEHKAVSTALIADILRLLEDVDRDLLRIIHGAVRGMVEVGS